MAFLTINAVDYDVQVDGARRQENVRIGNANSRAFSGGLRSSVRAEKRQWEYTLAPLTAAQVATLRGAIANNAFVNCQGTFLGGVISCGITISEEQFIPDGSDGTIYKSLLRLTLIEV